MEFVSGITQSVQLSQVQWSRVGDTPKRSGPVRRDPIAGERGLTSPVVSDSLDQFREVHSPRSGPPRQVRVQTTPRIYVYEDR